MSEFEREKIWSNVPEIGNLIIEEMLVVANFPILFVCVDGCSLYRYLVMTYDYYGSEYVISKVDSSIICKMLKNEIPMDEAFKQSKFIYFTKYDGDTFTSEKYESAVFDPGLLPQKGAFFELKLNYIDEYIKKLEKIPQFLLEYDLPTSRTDSINESLNYNVCENQECFEDDDKKSNTIAFTTIYDSAA